MRQTMILWTFGLLLPLISAQILTTKCPTYWTKYKERCYLIPAYRHSWHRAKSYCEKYGAKLVQPTGFEINNKISQDVTGTLTDVDSFWTGYHRPDNTQPAHLATWSDGRPTSVEVGVWGQSEPNTAVGQYAWVSTQDSKWYMGDSNTVRNFVCEMDPCPSGTRDTYMCNGKCLSTSTVCNGVNDCGNNQDENNCATVLGRDCTTEYEGTSGTITMSSTSEGRYQPNLACSWTVKTSPDKRIVLQFVDFETEPNTDYVEIWDGGLTISTSQLAARLSGPLDEYTFTSSYNFVTIRFVSDSSTQYPAGHINWKTDVDCGYDSKVGYGYSNREIEFDTTKLPSIKTTESCKDECDGSTSCYGFRYKASERTCYFINRLPVLQMDSSSNLWIKKCYGETTVQAGVPLFPVELSATTEPKQLATPFHPNPYVAMEIEYTIKAPANNLITLEVLYIDLCCGDSIYIYDKDRDLLETLNSDSTPTTILSTGNTVHLKMELFEHWKCNGALIQYTQGCDVRIVGSGTLSSPGYGTSKSYPDLMECYWTLYAPSEDRSVTVVFEDFDLDQDNMMVVPYSGSAVSYTGTSLHGQSRTEETMVTLAMRTGSRYSGRGFKASFSPGCPVLDSPGYVASPPRFDFGDHVNLTCAEGFMFGGAYSQQTYLSLTCESGGHWSIPNVPPCSQGNCGPAPFVANGYIETSGGSAGGSVTGYLCKTNYTLVGSSSITCLADGNWEQPPTCVSDLCGSISTLAPTTDPEVLFLDGELHGSVVHLSCDDVNQEIIGAETVQCISGQFDFASNTDPSFCKPIPCEIPIIENAVLTPEPVAGYILGQGITVACVEGYVMNGVANFSCGSNISFPNCLIRTCSLADFDHVIPSDGSDQSVYMYADDVNVTCEEGFYLEGISTSDMTVTCMNTGEWSHAVTCGKPSCGEPYTVPGSFYVPDTNSNGFCYEHGCSFTFQCRNKYVRFGNSSLGNHTVTCGMVYDGLWDLGDLRCIGGQCPDPGYPASGKLIGDSFEEGARVNFSCTQLGYEPLVSSGHVSQGMICHYNATSDRMEWIGEMPECKDTQAPIISSCDGGTVTYRTDMLMPLIGALDPQATDNNNIKTVEHFPENVYLSQPFDDAKTITWFFYDFDGNSNGCIVDVVIPASIDCRNDESTQLILNSDSYFSVADYVEQKNGAARLVYEPESFQIQANVNALNTVYEAQVFAFNGDTDEILDKCTIQLRFSAPVCATWAFEIPNGIKDCSGSTCNITCNAGSYFMEDPTLTFILMHCNSSHGWDREPPVCAEGFESYLMFTAKYDYKYFIQDGVTDSTTCVAAYKPIIQQNLAEFAAAMEGPCTEAANKEVSISLREDRTYLEYILGTKRLTVNFEFLISVNDSLSGATAAKETCANGVIQSKLNIEQDIDTIYDLISPATGCNSGVFDLTTTQTMYGYDCKGYRRLQPYTRVCLNCPLGYYYNEFNCVQCPEGTYGQESANGSMCQTCPDSRNPGLTGQTDISSCFFKEPCPEGYFSFDGIAPCEPCPIGYYSAESYSRTCASCVTNEVTYSTASTSIVDCKTLSEAVADNAVTPCTPDNPCMNGGTCGFVKHDYNCTCPPGYTGRTCESRFDSCTSNPCKNGKECVTTPGSDTFSCICSANPSADSELSGDLCEIDTFGCAESFCRNNGTCHNQFQSHSCKCPTYSGYQNEDGTCGTQIEPCEVEPKCQHGACIPNSHFYKTCDCEAGWTGIYCENNINDCDPSYCENGATCKDGVNSFRCECTDGFFGPYCQFRISCDRKCVDLADEYCNTCVDNSTEECVSVNNDFMCICQAGFAGRSCEVETSVCKSFPCQHGGTCTAIDAKSFSCECMHPWTGDHCENQINYCPNGDECFNGGTCYSTSSGYRCRCSENFIGDNCSIAYNLCERANPCAAPRSNCSFSDGVFQCSCPTGYTGDYCENKPPSCSDNLCQNGGTCMEDAAGATCTCPQEFSGSFCDSEIDACSSNPCLTNQDCVNVAGKYTCTCAAGYRGQDCDKSVGEDFDYVITPMQLCREEASMAVFGDGKTDIVAFTISFWARYTALHGSGVILNVFGSKSGGSLIPATPDFSLTFYADRVDADVTDTSTSRKKREVKSLVYPSSIADGYWHHLVVTWLATSGELTLYIDGDITDQIIFSENSPVANIGYLVFSEFDAYIGTTVPEESFEGRISRITIVNTELPLNIVQQLYTRSPVTAGVLLHPERTTMQMYPIDYNSELNINRNKCTLDDNTCKRLVEAADVPETVSCPTDAFVVTEREVRPNWTDPVFGGTNSVISNYPSGGAGFDFGLYGISYAGFDPQGDASTCTFRLFYYDVGCGDDDWDSAACDDISQGGKRCQGDCSANQLLTGSLPRYQTCSMYGMWDEAVKYASYLFPECSDSSDITQKVMLELTANLSNGTCSEELKESYSVAVLGKINQLNAQQTDSDLCPSNCVSLLVPAFSCDGIRIKIVINFGILSSSMMYEGESVTTEDLLKIAVGDFEAFTYVGASSTDISPDLSTLNVSVREECAAGYMVSSGRCVLCGKGTSYDASTKTCKRCPVGSYRSVLTNTLSACTTCPSSLTTPTDGATDATYCITRCLEGQFFRLPSNPNVPANAGTCTSCPVGYYQDETTGALSCKPCPYGLTTASSGSTAFSDCVAPESLTTTTTTSGPAPDVGAATEGGGLSVGAIVAVVLGVIIVLAVIILIVCFCCCKELLPCLSKKKQVVSPIQKDGYYAKKYGDLNMHFVSYNLQDVREKKGKPLDRIPFVEPPMSDETGSVKTDISVHVPVFIEKMDGKVKRKSIYMSNGGQSLNASLPRSGRTPRDPVMTSSPRETQYVHEMEGDAYVQPKQKRRRKHRKDRSTSEKRSRRRYEKGLEPVDQHAGVSLPRALAPVPHRLVSKPPDDVILRASSPLEQPRVQVIPSQYEDFISHSPTRGHRSNRSPRSSRSRDKDRSKSRHRPRSYDDDEAVPRLQHTGEYDEEEASFRIKRIKVESDEDS